MIFIGIHLVDHYLEKQDLDNYLDLLGDKISDMVPDDEKDEFKDVYASFLEQVAEEEVPMTDLAQLADRIVEIRKREESISADRLREILPVARVSVLEEPVNEVVSKVEFNLHWKELAQEFETAYETSDSIRIEKKHHIELKNHIEEQLKIHSEITESIETNYYDALDKVEILKDEITDFQVQQELIKEMEILKSENQNLNKKIIALDEIKKVIAVERVRLQEELKKIDSTTQSLNW